jgi:hypothetical protein
MPSFLKDMHLKTWLPVDFTKRKSLKIRSHFLSCWLPSLGSRSKRLPTGEAISQGCWFQEVLD